MADHLTDHPWTPSGDCRWNTRDLTKKSAKNCACYVRCSRSNLIYLISYRFTVALPPCKPRACFWISAWASLPRYLSMFAWLSHSEYEMNSPGASTHSKSFSDRQPGCLIINGAQ